MDHTECFVSGALAAILRFSKFLGIAPLRFVKAENGWRISISSRSSYIGYFVMALSNIIIIWNLIAKTVFKIVVKTKVPVTTRATFTWKGLHRVVWHTEILIITTLAATLVYNAPTRMRSLIECLNKVQKINSDLHICPWPTQYKKNYIGYFILWMTTLIAVTINGLVALFIVISLTRSELLTILIFFVYHFYYLVIQLGITQYILELLQVRSSFKGVNDSLRNLLQAVTKKRLLRHEVDVVRRVSYAYMSACGVVRDVDRTHGLRVMMLLSSCFIFLVITPYYIINAVVTELAKPNPIHHTVYLLEQCFWALLHVTSLVLIIEPCHLTHVEIKITQDLIGHLQRRTLSINDPLAVELHQFQKLITLNEVSYQPLMIISMTRGLVVQILGSITTYLAIIVEIEI